MDTYARPALWSVDLSDCEALATLDPGDIAALFSDALGRAGASIVQAVSHVFPGSGLTCVLILRESHAVLHTWPETGAVNIDIFACSARLKVQDAIDDLKGAFGARGVQVHEIHRANGHSPQPEPSR